MLGVSAIANKNDTNGPTIKIANSNPVIVYPLWFVGYWFTPRMQS
ncbi:hypothetical protein PLAN_40301 [Planktothrix rubescens CCAP 1459/22]|uniref:Uncharacterized protein n=1 Tax=Planktothrix rubescens CCAP 1459/22 TaxID=329571 RepID=A0A6J7ZNA0_PLARU|nr:hypothetical protein PLAN_40301 [Planktothrix rubescens NIVA-CYA 18]CAD0230271.1 conserved hypothetical protein [Planktothrix agardhii]